MIFRKLSAEKIGEKMQFRLKLRVPLLGRNGESNLRFKKKKFPQKISRKNSDHNIDPRHANLVRSN
jgi:hypothetical protein